MKAARPASQKASRLGFCFNQAGHSSKTRGPRAVATNGRRDILLLELKMWANQNIAQDTQDDYSYWNAIL